MTVQAVMVFPSGLVDVKVAVVGIFDVNTGPSQAMRGNKWQVDVKIPYKGETRKFRKVNKRERLFLRTTEIAQQRKIDSMKFRNFKASRRTIANLSQHRSNREWKI